MEPEQIEEFNWINIAFLQNVIRSYKNDNSIEVNAYKIKPTFQEHFASIMFPCQIDFKFLSSEVQTLHVVIKACPTNESGKTITFTDGPLFHNEISMYSKTIPEINRLLERAGLGNKIAPELIYATDNPFLIIVLEDLTYHGFSAPYLPLNELDDTKEIIKRLAQFHAASYYLSEMSELDLTHYNYCFYESDFLMESFRTDVLQPFREVLENWEGYEHFVHKIDYLIKHIGEIGHNCYTANRPGTGYNVLNHGDFHPKNTMLKMNCENRLNHFYFIDFQLSVYCSPAIDLNYVTTMVKRDENGEIPFEDLVVFYHERFVEALKSFGFTKQVPTLLDLNVELLRHGQINVVLMLLFTPFAFVDREKKQSEEASTGTDDRSNFRKNLYNHPIYKKLMQKSLKRLEQKGLL